MEYADIAFFARNKGEVVRFLEYSQLAFENERAAALMIENEDSEPTRSVFHRSAEVLALDFGQHTFPYSSKYQPKLLRVKRIRTI